MHIIKLGLSGPRDYLPRWLGHSTVQPNWPRSAGHGGHVPGSPFQDLPSCYYCVHVQTQPQVKFTETSTETGPNKKNKTTGNMDVFTDLNCIKSVNWICLWIAIQGLARAVWSRVSILSSSISRRWFLTSLTAALTSWSSGPTRLNTTPRGWRSESFHFLTSHEFCLTCAGVVYYIQ